jgi:toxin ParE1/3/4
MIVIWSASARADLRALRQYISQDAPGTAAVVVVRLRAAVQNLEQFPWRGRPGHEPDTRELIAPRTSYIVVYKVVDDVVRIHRIQRGARQWPTPE